MKFDLTDIDHSYNKVSNAITLIKAMVSWFYTMFEDPVENTPWDGEEGGYQYACGGPYSAHDAIVHAFAHELIRRFDAGELDEIIGTAVEQIESGGVIDWARIEPLEVTLLHANAHRWGPGHIHEFNREEDRTLCGRSLAACPGVIGVGPEKTITCKSCLRVKRGEPA
jgi:hypothetical protein